MLRIGTLVALLVWSGAAGAETYPLNEEEYIHLYVKCSMAPFPPGLSQAEEVRAVLEQSEACGGGRIIDEMKMLCLKHGDCL